MLKQCPMLGGWCARFCKASRGPDRRVVLVLDEEDTAPPPPPDTLRAGVAKGIKKFLLQ